MTEGFDNRIAADEEAERLARGQGDEEPGGGEDQAQSSDAADVMVTDEGGSEAAPK